MFYIIHGVLEVSRVYVIQIFIQNVFGTYRTCVWWMDGFSPSFVSVARREEATCACVVCRLN